MGVWIGSGLTFSVESLKARDSEPVAWRAMCYMALTPLLYGAESTIRGEAWAEWALNNAPSFAVLIFDSQITEPTRRWSVSGFAIVTCKVESDRSSVRRGFLERGGTAPEEVENFALEAKVGPVWIFEGSFRIYRTLTVTTLSEGHSM